MKKRAMEKRALDKRELDKKTLTNTAQAHTARSQARLQLGLSPDKPTGLVTFGGNGSDTMRAIADKLAALKEEVQFIFICGHNQALADELNRYSGAQERAVIGFTEDMAHFMSLCDFVIGKPGNVSISEAVVMKRPVITQCGLTTMRQERYCAEWVRAQKVGIVIRSFNQINKAVLQLLEPSAFAQYQRNLENVDNQAGFEVVELLDRLLSESESSRSESSQSDFSQSDSSHSDFCKAVGDSGRIETRAITER